MAEKEQTTKKLEVLKGKTLEVAKEKKNDGAK